MLWTYSRLRVRGVLVLSMCAGALTIALSIQPSAAWSATRIRVGTVPHPAPGARVVGPLPSGTQIGATVTLKPRDPAALAAYATAVATAGSGVFHDYITPAQFARRFGPSTAQIAAVSASLRAHGLHPQAVSANGLAIRVAGSAGQLAKAFSTSFERVVVPGSRAAYANTSAPALDASVAGHVQGVIGLDTLSLPQPLALRSRSTGTGHLIAPRLGTGGPQPCSAATAAAPAQSAYTADQIASAYDFSGFYAGGDFGAGQTVALYELEGNFPADIAAYQSCYGTSASVSYQEVDGGPPAPASGVDGLESALDIEDVIGLAPQASVIVYQGPNNASGAPGYGPYDTFNAIISQDRAQVISTSWGECEPNTSTSPESQVLAENTLFEEAATQGQSIFAASGDDGSEDCYGTALGSSANALAVDDPGSQPFVTDVGGTTLSAVGPPPPESAWNDPGYGASGGGISSLWQMPAYQSDAPAALNVINANSSGAPCGSPVGADCRELPDVAADASDESRYLMYWDGGWVGIYGTSGAAPTWASLAALANASPACGGSPIGFANPALYRAAGSSAYASIFNDISTGNNDFLSGHAGLFPAGVGYDMATGLGSPVASKLGDALCDKVTIANPGPQTSTVGGSVTLLLTGASSAGASLQYAATDLPAGLSINRATGVVSGAPTSPGTWGVTVVVSSADGVTGSATFAWNVIPTPVATATPASMVIEHPANQTGTVGKSLKLQLHAHDSNGGGLSFGASGLPHGLSINASGGLISGTPTAAGTSTVTVTAVDAGGPSASASLTWTVSAAMASIRSPGKQMSTVGRPVDLKLHAQANNGGPVSYGASGLPHGVSIDASSGLISGTPTAARTWAVTVKATAPGGGSATASFRWIVRAAVSVERASVSGIGQGATTVSLMVAATYGSPWLKRLVIGLPNGLRFSNQARSLVNGIALKGPGGSSLKFTATVRPGTLTIALEGTANEVQVTISSIALAMTNSLSRALAHQQVKRFSLVVKATNASQTTTQFRLTLKGSG